jgi:hypothetical protein
MNRTELQALSDIRLKEAYALWAAGLSDGAYYLAGYAVECALKACIAKRTKEHDFPEKPEQVRKFYVHKLTELMILSQLAPLLEVAVRANPSLKDRWSIVQRWSEDSRYERRDSTSAEAVLKAIEDGSEGILPWIRLHW